MSRPRLDPSRCLYGILDTGYLNSRDPLDTVSRMIEGGVDLLQIRAKQSDAETVWALCEQVLPRCREANVPLILNDHPEWVKQTGVDGVHVGQDDLSIAETRKMVGPDRLIGKSTHSREQGLQALKEDVDYIGVGPIFATPTKPDYQPVGLDLVRWSASHQTLPFYCIGGIKLENLDKVVQAGGRRVVVVSGILLAEDIAHYCRELKKRMT